MIKNVPKEVYTECLYCDSCTKHRVLKGRLGKNFLEGIFRCEGCQHTKSTTIQIPRSVKIPVVISNGSTSRTSSTEVEEGEIIMVNDEFLLENGERLKVCSLDLGNGQRKKKASSENIKTIWAKQFDNLCLKVTVNHNNKSYSRRVSAEPDDEFLIGQVLVLSDMECYIHAIKSRAHVVLRGTVEARDVVRIYGKMKQWTKTAETGKT
ncbi:MAG: hypothetical protein MJY64_03315 [archaeon]|nr:hypothetical protein [archaeon]